MQVIPLFALLMVAVSAPLLFSDVSAVECDHGELPRCDELFDTNGAFITTWVTSTPNEAITIPSFAGTSYSINWGDGNVDLANGDTSHTYRYSGTYTVTIERSFPGINLERNLDSALKLKEITQWGDIQWSTMEGAFYGAANMNITASDSPDLSNVENMDKMFANARTFNADINSWDVSNVTSMKQTFMLAQSFDSPLDNWDVSNVNNMSDMFSNAKAFNKNISSWNVSNVTNMSGMFMSASSFNQPLNWNTSSVSDMSDMFNGATSFNQPLNWNTSSANTMSGMFAGATSFNQPLYQWNVWNVTDMSNMFNGATSFNSTLSHHYINDIRQEGWVTYNLKNMSGMFAGATSFNQPLQFTLIDVTNMSGLFNGATSFNQNINNWAVSNVTDMLVTSIRVN